MYACLAIRHDALIRGNDILTTENIVLVLRSHYETNCLR
jgi:hypothetical protein